jgi:short-subunit dehydrogenase
MAKRQETIVITGASAGVGRATAREFAKHGSYVALLSRGEAALEAARAEVEALGGRALILQVDVANAEQIEKAAATVEQELGPIDVWINNAMVSVFSPFKVVVN